MPDELCDYITLEGDGPQLVSAHCSHCGNLLQYIVASEPRFQFLFCLNNFCQDWRCTQFNHCMDNAATNPCDVSCIIELTPEGGVRLVDPYYIAEYCDAQRAMVHNNGSTHVDTIGCLSFAEDKDIGVARLLGSALTGGYYTNDE